MQNLFCQFRTSSLALGLLLTGCAPVTFDDLCCEGESEMKKLTAELCLIETPEDVHKASKRLKRRFDRLAQILIATRKFQGQVAESTAVGEALFVEMARIYEIPGVREAIEATQCEAVRSLDHRRK
ncbi:MAG: hypothetical protein HY861_05400 [Chlamydiia bacterium]|nr:hypothetical protein [Chlamydiia bacterium]